MTQSDWDQDVPPGTKAFEGNETQAASRAEGSYEVNPDSAADDVGESTTRRGEDMMSRDGKEEGRGDLGHKGPSDRPVGTASPDDSTGVGSNEPIHDDMPNMPSGDQGG
ncbi:MAG TPA: hypothetical protein VGR21_06495 [Cryptosporangiaceae bacterium]|nr:hypothetical protein [Cryptosporangiaceae bacterium]